MTAPLRTRATELISELTLDEKLLLLSGDGMWATARVGAIPATQLANGPNGVGKQAGEADHVGGGEQVPATCFPSSAALASTWDVPLLEELGAALGLEASAENVDVLLGPGLNIKRHPGGGRVFEYFSEDPHQAGKVAAALVRGVQSQGVGTSIKHFAANNQETDRMRLNSVIDERTLREIYLTGFETVVREAEPWTVMTSYNLVNGEHTGEHHHLLADILRCEWGFTGLVMSDWMATADRPVSLQAGLDLEMPGNGGLWAPRVRKALDDGTLQMADVDRAAARVAELALRAEEARATRPTELDREQHHLLARRAAAAGTVLLSNDGLLPLRAEGRLALIGVAAEKPRFQGVGSAKVTPWRLDTALDAMRARLGDSAELVYTEGYDGTTGAVSDTQRAAARDAASGADVAVLLLAIPAGKEAEGVDRTELVLPEDMNELVRAVTAANPRTVVVLVNGAPLELPWAEEPAALLEAYLGGQAAGPAIVDVLFGDAEPGGRLTESFPVRAADIPASQNFPTTNTQVQYREGLYVGYRFHDTFDAAPRFAFGHGLSYTSFEYGALQINGDGTELRVSVSVTNSGPRSGSEVVQLYVRDLESTVHRPHQELKAFTKVHLVPGETTVATLQLDRRSFAFYDTESATWMVEAGDFELRVGASSRDIRSTATVGIESDARPTPVAAPAGPVATTAEFARMLGRPVPDPVQALPYTSDSTIEDLRTTWLGRRMHGVLLGAISKMLPPSDDPDTTAMMVAVVSGMPLRAMTVSSGGKISLDTLDRVIGLLNAASPAARRARRRQPR